MLEGMKNTSGAVLSRSAVQLAVVHMLQLYIDAINNSTGDISKISVYPTVYAPTMHTLHLSYATVQRLFQPCLDIVSQCIDSGGVIAQEQLEALLDGMVSHADNPRGPKPLAYRTSRVTSSHILLINEFIKTRCANGAVTVAKHIRSMLATCDDPVDISMDVTYRLLAAMGMHYEERSVNRFTPEKEEQFYARIDRFLLEYAAAKRDPDLVFCYMDESYVHHHHASKASYYPADDVSMRLTRPASRGRRHVIVHCITADGILHFSDELTCEWIFLSNGSKDYHENMNGDNFYKWLVEKFAPTFKALYPTKRAVLVLDNAPYHHARDPLTFVDPFSMHKPALLAKMVQLGMTEMTVTRTAPGPPPQPPVDITFDMRPWSVPGAAIPRAPKGPSLEEMQTALHKCLMEKCPAALESRIVQFFKKENWTLVFTPPYCPQFQPIELVWAHCKGFVAQQYTNERNMAGTADQLRQALRGDHPPSVYSKLDCAKLIAHCEKEMLAAATRSGAFQDHKGDIRCIIRADPDTAPTSAAAAMQATLNDVAQEEELIDNGDTDSDNDEH